MNAIGNSGNWLNTGDAPTFQIDTPGKRPSFSQQVAGYLEQVNAMQGQADEAAGKMALGDVRSLHSVMIASEEASLGLSTVLQVRNKALESYQEVMRMQV